MDVVTSLWQLTEISEYISKEIRIGGDPYLQNRTPMPFIFKNEWSLAIAILGHLEGVEIIYLCLSVLIFKAAPQNKLAQQK